MHVDTRTVTSVVLAFACVVAVAAAADGFASLSTDPEDLVDPEFDRLPVGEGSMESLREEVASRRGTGGARPETGDGGESAAESGPAETQREVTTRADSSSAQADAAASEASSASRRDPADSDSGDQSPPPGRDWRALLAALVVLAVAAALAYRYADRFGGGGDEPSTAFGDADPDSEVERAWLALVRRVDDAAEHPEARTPGEWAAAAVDAGLDADAVATLTRAFESVRYGGRDETEKRRRRVRRAVDRLDALPRETDGGTGTERAETDAAGADADGAGTDAGDGRGRRR